METLHVLGVRKKKKQTKSTDQRWYPPSAFFFLFSFLFVFFVRPTFQQHRCLAQQRRTPFVTNATLRDAAKGNPIGFDDGALSRRMKNKTNVIVCARARSTTIRFHWRIENAAISAATPILMSEICFLFFGKRASRKKKLLLVTDLRVIYIRRNNDEQGEKRSLRLF